MKKNFSIWLICTIAVGSIIIPGFAQTKLTTGNQILYKLGTSAQLAKEQWEFGFSKDECIFNKTKKFKERDGTTTSSFVIAIPLDQVEIALEVKSYDSFFQCSEHKNCVTKTWYAADGSVMESQETDAESLYIKQADLAQEVFNLFAYLRTLCDRSQYVGPSGIKWGDSIETVTPVLSARFQFVDQKTVRNGALFQQTYLDQFAGQKTEAIRVGFVDNKFYEMLVIPEVKPKASIAKKWYEVVYLVIDKYGKPNSIVLPASIKNLEEITNETIFKDLGVFDLEIRENQWQPLAIWNYNNDVIIKVAVVPTAIDWEVHWQFLHRELEKLAEVRIAEHPVDDF